MNFAEKYESQQSSSIYTLNASKSCSPDTCHPFFLRECGEETYLPLSEIFQRFISTGDVPNDWKKANITCIFKKGNKQKPTNYRPVSLISVLCKLLESYIKGRCNESFVQTQFAI